MRYRAATWLVLLSTWCARGAWAQPTPNGDDPRARQFFEVGQQAYEQSQYLLAIEAFEQAYVIVQRPGLLFSLGQAHQRQFRLKADEGHLQAALDYYRRYLAADPEGRRRGEALAAIESLAGIAKELHPEGSEAPAQIFGKLLISSATPGIVVSVGGDRVETLPALLELPKRSYLVLAQAPGYAPERHEVQIEAGRAVPLQLELRALPAGLLIQGPAGAEAFVDGRPIGFLPTPTLSFSAGPHWVSLRQAGRRTRNARVDLTPGESVRTELTLEPTTQRSATWVAGTSGAITLLATAICVGVAVNRDSVASDWEARRERGQLSRAQAEQLNAAVDARDRFRTFAVVGGVSTAALVGAALVLYVTDTPAPPSLPEQRFNSARGFELRGFGDRTVWGATLARRF